MLPAVRPWQVEDAKRSLLVYGNKTSQVIKDVMTDLHKLKGVRACPWGLPAYLRLLPYTLCCAASSFSSG